MTISNERQIYMLTVEDIRTVSSENCIRALTDKEIELIENKVGDYIDWYEALLAAINDVAPDAIGDPEEEYDEGEEK